MLRPLWPDLVSGGAAHPEDRRKKPGGIVPNLAGLMHIDFSPIERRKRIKADPAAID